MRCTLWWPFSKTNISVFFYHWRSKKIPNHIGKEKRCRPFPIVEEKKKTLKRITKNFKEKHCWPIIQPRHFARRVSFFIDVFPTLPYTSISPSSSRPTTPAPPLHPEFYNRHTETHTLTIHRQQYVFIILGDLAKNSFIMHAFTQRKSYSRFLFALNALFTRKSKIIPLFLQLVKRKKISHFELVCLLNYPFLNEMTPCMDWTC